MTEPQDLPEPPRLRRLRRLVTTLMITLIAGFILIVVTLVLRLTATPPPLVLPEEIPLPAGESAAAVTFGDGWIALVTRDASGTERIRILDRVTGDPIAEVPITGTR